MSKSFELSLAFRCPKKFEELSGARAGRFCDQCSKCVTNLSALSKKDATEFLSKAKANTCVRYTEAQDGTIRFRSSWYLDWFTKFRRYTVSCLAFAIPSSFAIADESCPSTPQPNPPATCSEEDEWEFMGELSPFKVQLFPNRKGRFNFHTRKNYENHKPLEQANDYGSRPQPPRQSESKS